MKLNKEWHATHRMPQNASIEDRISWHLEHQKHCKCREIPEKFLMEIKKRKESNDARNY